MIDEVRPKRRYSQNAYLRGAALDKLRGKIFADHKTGAKVKALRVKYELSEARIRRHIRKAKTDEYRGVTAPAIIAAHVAANDAANIPLNAFYGDEDSYHWLQSRHPDIKTVGQAKALYEEFTRQHVSSFLGGRFADEIAKLEALLGPVGFMTAEAFQERADRRVAAHISQDILGVVRYIDFDPRAASYVMQVHPCTITLGEVYRLYSSDDYRFGNFAYANGKRNAELDRILVALERHHRGPSDFRKLIEKAKAHNAERNSEMAARAAKKDPILRLQQQVKSAASDLRFCLWIVIAAGLILAIWYYFYIFNMGLPHAEWHSNYGAFQARLAKFPASRGLFLGFAILAPILSACVFVTTLPQAFLQTLDWTASRKKLASMLKVGRERARGGSAPLEQFVAA
jgi:hypothetical protein